MPLLFAWQENNYSCTKSFFLTLDGAKAFRIRYLYLMVICSLGSSLIIFSSFLIFRSLVKNDSLGNFDFNRQRHLDFSSNFVG